MVDLTINLDPNSDGKTGFQPGHIVRGSIRLTLHQEKKIRGCYVVVFGLARAHWTEEKTQASGTGINRRTLTYTVHYEGKEIFFKSKTYLFGHINAAPLSISEGSHEYSFACKLPEAIPYTLDGRFGHIRYYVEACLEVPWKFDKEVKKSFTVVRTYDLSKIPQLRIGKKVDEIANFGCLFCKSGPLHIKVAIPCSGFAAGQTIPVHVYYKNESNVPVRTTKIKLRRVISFNASKPEAKIRKDCEIVAVICARGVAQNQTVDMICNLEVPKTVLNSNVAFCNVVCVGYSIVVEAMVGGWNKSPTVELPIIIGSIPVNKSTTSPSKNSSQIAQVRAPNESLHISTVEQILPPLNGVVSTDDSPPSFEEAIGMAKPSEHQIN